METMPLEQFQALLKDNFPSIEQAEFICPSCKTVQTPQDLIDAGAGKDIEEVNGFIGFSCVGRWNKDKGCNWTLGGLFKCHELELEITHEDFKDPRPCFKLNIKDQTK